MFFLAVRLELKFFLSLFQFLCLTQLGLSTSFLPYFRSPSGLFSGAVFAVSVFGVRDCCRLEIRKKMAAVF